MVSSRREMSHILGLFDYPGTEANEGWADVSALKSLKNRFHKLSGILEQLELHSLADFSSDKLTKEISQMTNGGYLGFLTGWKEHTYTIHAVKEGDRTHFIYVNRGESHYDLATEEDIDDPHNVFVFTVPNDKAGAFAKELFSAAKSDNSRKSMSEFLDKYKSERNADLSQVLAKKDQKPGNCTIANSNIAWHFQLASNYMKQNPGSTFAEAYGKTQERYRKMRYVDRKEAFQYLFRSRFFYDNAREYLYNYFQAINKFAGKDARNPELPYLDTLIDIPDPKKFRELAMPFLSDIFSIYANEYIEDRRKCLEKSQTLGADEKEYLDFAASLRKRMYIQREHFQILNLKKSSPQEQEEIIKEEFSLLMGANQDLQRKYLGKDFNKYCLYADPDVLKSYGHFDQQKLQGREKYLGFMVSVKSSPKTAGDLMLSQGSDQKQAMIDSQFSALVSYLFMDDSEKIKKSFEELCKICGKKRFVFFGDEYSSTIASSQWLIQQLQSEDEVVVKLRKTLGIKSDEVEATVQGIIEKLNNAPEKTTNFNRRAKSQSSGEEEETNPEETPRPP